MSIAQDEQKVTRTLFFRELSEIVGGEGETESFTSLADFAFEGISKDGLLLYSSELDQWVEIKIIFKKEDFDGIRAIELYQEQQKKNQEKAEKKKAKIEVDERKREKAEKLKEKLEETQTDTDTEVPQTETETPPIEDETPYNELEGESPTE